MEGIIIIRRGEKRVIGERKMGMISGMPSYMIS